MLDTSVALAVQRFSRETPDKTACIAKGEKCDYKTLALLNRKTALYLKNKGVKPGDRVIVEADHTLEYVYFWYGIQLLGACFVPVEKNTPSKRIAEIAEELDSGFIVTLAKRSDLPEAFALCELIDEIKQTEDLFIPEAASPDALAEILFTTGTTGKSKGVMVSFENQMNIALAGAETTDIRQDNVWLIPTPMNHAAGLRKVHIAFSVGSSVVLLEGFRNFKQYFNTIDEYGVTSLYLPPSAIHLLLAFASKNLAALNGRIRFIYSSSTAYPETDKEKMRQLMPDVYMYNCFGCSEVGVVCTDEFCVSGGSRYAGSVGKPNSLSEILILDEDGNEIKDSSHEKTGFAAIRSKSVMKGYWNEPEQTAKAIKNGMLVMSDICYFSPDGELILVGRSNDTINLGGFKIAPSEVEETVMKLPFADECLLIPATIAGNTALKLLVVLKDKEKMDENAIRSLIADTLEPYKMPKIIAEVPEIIRTFNGKTDRKQMIAIYG